MPSPFLAEDINEEKRTNKQTLQSMLDNKNNVDIQCQCPFPMGNFRSVARGIAKKEEC